MLIGRVGCLDDGIAVAHGRVSALHVHGRKSFAYPIVHCRPYHTLSQTLLTISLTHSMNYQVGRLAAMGSSCATWVATPELYPTGGSGHTQKIRLHPIILFLIVFFNRTHLILQRCALPDIVCAAVLLDSALLSPPISSSVMQVCLWSVQPLQWSISSLLEWLCCSQKPKE